MPDNALYYRLAYAATLVIYVWYALSLVLRRRPGRSGSAPVLSMGEWFLTLLGASIPLVNLVVLVLWALNESENPNRANFAKALLFVLPVFFALSWVLYLAISRDVSSVSVPGTGA